jgi:biotin carboxyl carrier protein
MTRVRVTDLATGQPVADVDRLRDRHPAAGPEDPATTKVATDPSPAPPGERPTVIPLADRPTTRGRTAVEVVVAGWRFDFELEDANLADLRARAMAGREAAIHDGPTEVRAIIPGRVVSVAVIVGDAVEAGQRLLAVEAMKMENELRAPRGGTVERVAVAVGQTVELGDPLVVIR